ncbi:inositol-pentakisphosphate 2-kinase [Trametes polyzona]|nr:inositol-pentakisphosphate 2-kinase [Trametes polyzona]
MAEEVVHITQTTPEDWKYIAEGGSTIVFSYVGPPNPQFDGTALRLRKRPTSAHEDPVKYQKPQLGSVGPTGAPGTSEGDEEGGLGEEEPDDPTIVFQRTVISRLVPAQHLPRLRSVLTQRAWLAALAERTERLRPPARRAKDEIDVDRRKAVLATDLVGGEGLVVEIKPKWGFLPQGTHLPEDTRAIKTRTCRFCMHAHLKNSDGTAVALGYCPLDLYSGDATRVEHALRTLWDIWLAGGGSVNNLRVFVDGKLVKPSTSDVHALDRLRDAFVGTLGTLLLASPVLRTLSRLQRTLDALDVDGLAALWERVRPGVPFGRALNERTGDEGAGEDVLSEPTIDDWVRFVDAYLARMDDPPAPLTASAKDDVDESPESPESPSGSRTTHAELRFRILAYLLSASFKDCSLILRPVRPVRPEREKGTITVIDLDVKGVERLPRWRALDRAIVDAYRAVHAPRTCTDAWAGCEPLP